MCVGVDGGREKERETDRQTEIETWRQTEKECECTRIR